MPLERPPVTSVTSEVESAFAQLQTSPSKTLRSGGGFHSRTRSLFGDSGVLNFFGTAHDSGAGGTASYRRSSLVAGGGNPIASAPTSAVSSPKVGGSAIMGWHAESGGTPLGRAFRRAREEGTGYDSGARQSLPMPLVSNSTAARVQGNDAPVMDGDLPLLARAARRSSDVNTPGSPASPFATADAARIFDRGGDDSAAVKDVSSSESRREESSEREGSSERGTLPSEVFEQGSLRRGTAVQVPGSGTQLALIPMPPCSIPIAIS